MLRFKAYNVLMNDLTVSELIEILKSLPSNYKIHMEDGNYNNWYVSGSGKTNYTDGSENSAYLEIYKFN